MDAPPPDAAPSADPPPADESGRNAGLVRYYRIDFQRCVIRRGTAEEPVRVGRR